MYNIYNIKLTPAEQIVGIIKIIIIQILQLTLRLNSVTFSSIIEGYLLNDL